MQQLVYYVFTPSLYSDDCEWNAWEPWSPYCTKICGTDGEGTRQRIRTKQREEKDGGSPCIGLPMEELNCTSTEPCIGDYTLIIGGYNVNTLGTLDAVEVVSPDPISYPVPECTKDLGNLPTKIMGTVGTTFGEVPHLCGGKDDNNVYLNQCWKYDGQSDQWTHAGSMNEARYLGAAAHHQDLGFLITGGKGKSTTEITKDGVTFEAFTPLPIVLHSHCVVSLDGEDGDIFVGGGHGKGHGSVNRM